jgi:hypothetical protein
MAKITVTLDQAKDRFRAAHRAAKASDKLTQPPSTIAWPLTRSWP